eukprot:CAMPEP_0202705026 /NCGR_PEP_ID=MMETSP1385-20130828/17623_1 /ASSEMBLY_ACC=CAM_ASM_000861 /TAXON_ID=933848 /ORGANISM="Elphidium margaritaceum" /LENGTH=570 /DNA_ID=CAMNT_0049363171 /DNA_START=87 /DNA_END=1795 /DNA_ORIENTATION=+
MSDATDTKCTNDNESTPAAKKLKTDNGTIAKSASHQKQLQSGDGGTKYMKRKVALIVSYVGTKYHGSAFNGDLSIPTISGQLFSTLCEIGAISKENAIDPKKVAFSASSRTDKGVHAAAATFAVKMFNFFEDPEKERLLNATQKIVVDNSKDGGNVDDDDDDDDDDNKRKREYAHWPEMRALINSKLPSDICVQAIVRSTKNFDPRYKAWSRVYHYVCPTYLFDAAIKAADIRGLENTFAQYIVQRIKMRKSAEASSSSLASASTADNDMEAEAKNGDSNNAEDDDGAAHAAPVKISEEELDAIAKQMAERQSQQHCAAQKDIRFGYRISSALVDKLQELCQIYVGTRNYHNFTRKTHPNEDRAKRFMTSVNISNADIVVDDIQYVLIEIHGTSFLYHQIRKMVGFLVCLMRGTAYHVRDDETQPVTDAKKLMEFAFGNEHKMAIPLAPSQGLYLKAVRFDKYNIKCVRDGQKWKQLIFEDYDESINAFIMEKILPQITKYEVNQKNDNHHSDHQFAFWLYGLDRDFKYEVVEITEERKQQLKQRGLKFITAGNEHESIDKFLIKLLERT